MSISSDTRALRRYFTARLGPLVAVEHRHTPWRSATFGGARHCLTFTVDPAADVQSFIRDLPEADIPLVGGFVADAIATSVGAEDEGLRIMIEALVIEEA